jgi:hypothetical protein
MVFDMIADSDVQNPSGAAWGPLLVGFAGAAAVTMSCVWSQDIRWTAVIGNAASAGAGAGAGDVGSLSSLEAASENGARSLSLGISLQVMNAAGPDIKGLSAKSPIHFPTDEMYLDNFQNSEF